MPEKTYTLTELVTNIRKSRDEGMLTRLGVAEEAATAGLVLALGYEITVDGFQQFDADLTAAGL